MRGQVAILNITSAHLHSDTTCIIEVGDHEFIQHDSVIEYARGQVVASALLDSALNRGLLTPVGPAKDALVAKVRNGALASDFTPQKVQAAIEACNWAPAT